MSFLHELIKVIDSCPPTTENINHRKSSERFFTPADTIVLYMIGLDIFQLLHYAVTYYLMSYFTGGKLFFNISVHCPLCLYMDFTSRYAKCTHANTHTIFIFNKNNSVFCNVLECSNIPNEAEPLLLLQSIIMLI